MFFMPENGDILPCCYGKKLSSNIGRGKSSRGKVTDCFVGEWGSLDAGQPYIKAPNAPISMAMEKTEMSEDLISSLKDSLTRFIRWSALGKKARLSNWLDAPFILATQLV